jgi:hypothetical protein
MKKMIIAISKMMKRRTFWMSKKRLKITEEDGGKEKVLFRAELLAEGWKIEHECINEDGTPKDKIIVHSEFDYVIREMKKILFDS